ncbi:ferrichrome iron receptor [Rivularia sp. IAM M-261]|nr:ferrichrome iron receptor [Rivularia sp. IAM M-261]
MKRWCLSASIRLSLLISFSGCLSIFVVSSVRAEEKPNRQDVETRYISPTVQYEISSKIPQISEIELPATSATMLVQAPTNPTSQEGEQEGIVAITGVKANPTEKGVEVILETSEGDKLQVANRSTGNNFIVDISGGQLRLPSGDAFTFRSEKPISGITEIAVTNIDAKTVRVIVVGEKALPTVELFDDNAGLIFAVAEASVATQLPKTPTTEEKPTTEAPQEKPAAQQDDPIELVVTAEQDGYRAPNATTATRTDTPIRDIPQSIQVVPQEVLRDRQVNRISDGLENVSGVIGAWAPAGSRSPVTIRGFVNFGGNFLVNGIPDPQISSDGGFVNVERLEVLKGPSSVLFGQGSPSGTVNIITKQPLRDPFYEVSATVGSFSDYRGTIDFSGPLNDSKTALYRFNAAYQSYGSFLDFHEGKAISIAPNLAFNLGQNTNLTIEGDANILEQNGQQPEGQPAVGTVLPNPNGRIRRSFNAAGPQTDNLTINGRVGYRFEHRFSEDLKLRNSFLYTFYDDDDRDGRPGIFNGSLAADNRTLNRRFFIGSQFYDSYYLDTNLLGKFRAGTIEHQLLFGFSLNRNTTDLNFEFGNAAPVDIFNPVFNQTVVSTGIRTTDSFTTRDTLGIYLQDQIKFTDNLKLLLGGRVDIFEERANNRFTNVERSQSDTAFSPRVGIVYQPIPPISLYASFARSFTPTIGTSANGDAFVPERGTQYEVGIKADVNDRLSATLAFYDLVRSNVTTSDPGNPLFQVQTGEQRSQGIELDVSGEILPGWNIIAGYAYNIAEVAKDNTIRVGNRLNNAPEHAFNLWTTYRVQTGSLRGLGLGLGFYYVGDRQGDLANTFELPSYFRTDAAIFYERDRFRTSLNFRNLFDLDYYASARSRVRVDPGAPFSVQGTVSWQF